MKIEIKEEKENPFLRRKEFIVEVDHKDETTPSKAALQQYLVKELKKEAEYIDIRNIFSYSGMSKSKAKVFVLEEKKAQNLSKSETKEEIKEKAKPEQPAEEAPKEEPKQEPASEEVKPETKEEPVKKEAKPEENKEEEEKN